jgi:RNA recognition motif-containing protein
MHGQIHVANLSVTVDDRDLRRLFAAHGRVIKAEVTTDTRTGVGSGVGSVQMGSEQEADNAIEAMDGHVHRGHILSVDWTTRRQEAEANHSAMFDSMNMIDDVPPRKHRGPRPGEFGDRSGKHGSGLAGGPH